MEKSNRRFIFRILSGVLIGLAGCQQSVTESPRPSPDDGVTPTTATTKTNGSQKAKTSTDRANNTDCASGSIHVYYSSRVPDNATVKNASEDGFLEKEYFAGALSEAQREYQARQSSNGTDDQVFVTYSDGNILAHDEAIREKIGYAEKHYVEYENVTYQLEYMIAQC